MNAVAEQLATVSRAGTELARYEVSDGARRLVARRGCRGLELIDGPVDGAGRVYTVDSGWQDGGALEAFLKDYVSQAVLLDCCPVGREAVGVVVDTSGSAEIDELFAAIWEH
jgi:hypothetical protein